MKNLTFTFTFIFIVFMNLLSVESFNFNKPNMPKFDKNTDRALTVTGIIFTASFIPYFLDDDLKPNIYKDGLTKEEIALKRKHEYMSKYLEGDINKLYDLFPDFQIKID
jgi:hypothetical protein